jgi:hypothetical protein
MHAMSFDAPPDGEISRASMVSLVHGARRKPRIGR